MHFKDTIIVFCSFCLGLMCGYAWAYYHFVIMAAY
jgi:hypothetical protein